MAYFHYDRLTALDSMFLDLETETVHMHVGAVATYEARPVRTKAGALDIERIFAHADKALRKTPRFRQKLSHVPLFNRPVWVDDDRFRMREIYPVVPLFENQAAGIALFSYDGGLHWGFNSDWDAVPDLHDLVDATGAEFGLLRKIAAGAPAEIGRGAACTPAHKARPRAA